MLVILIIELCIMSIVMTLLYVSVGVQKETQIQLKELSSYLLESDLYVEEY